MVGNRYWVIFYSIATFQGYQLPLAKRFTLAKTVGLLFGRGTWLDRGAWLWLPKKCLYEMLVWLESVYVAFGRHEISVPRLYVREG